jgi:hypothetical protein
MEKIFPLKTIRIDFPWLHHFLLKSTPSFIAPINAKAREKSNQLSAKKVISIQRSAFSQRRNSKTIFCPVNFSYFLYA